MKDKLEIIFEILYRIVVSLFWIFMIGVFYISMREMIYDDSKCENLDYNITTNGTVINNTNFSLFETKYINFRKLLVNATENGINVTKELGYIDICKTDFENKVINCEIYYLQSYVDETKLFNHYNYHGG